MQPLKYTSRVRALSSSAAARRDPLVITPHTGALFGLAKGYAIYTHRRRRFGAHDPRTTPSIHRVLGAIARATCDGESSPTTFINQSEPTRHPDQAPDKRPDQAPRPSARQGAQSRRRPDQPRRSNDEAVQTAHSRDQSLYHVKRQHPGRGEQTCPEGQNRTGSSTQYRGTRSITQQFPQHRQCTISRQGGAPTDQLRRAPDQASRHQPSNDEAVRAKARTWPTALRLILDDGHGAPSRQVPFAHAMPTYRVPIFSFHTSLTIHVRITQSMSQRTRVADQWTFVYASDCTAGVLHMLLPSHTTHPTRFLLICAPADVPASQHFHLANAAASKPSDAALGLNRSFPNVSTAPMPHDTINLAQPQSKTPGMPVTDAANPTATPASRTAAIISSGIIECIFEGRVIEDHVEHAQSFTYGLCRLSETHRKGEHHARHLPAVHLVGADSLGPHDRPFEDGEELTLRVLPVAAAQSASLRNSSSRRVLLSPLVDEELNEAMPDDVRADDAQADGDVEARPSWELEGIGATVKGVLGRRHTAASRRRLSHGATECRNSNKCVGPRKLLTVAMSYTGESFCTTDPSRWGYDQTAEALWNSNFAPLGPAPPQSEWSPRPAPLQSEWNGAWYDALSTRFYLQ